MLKRLNLILQPRRLKLPRPGLPPGPGRVQPQHLHVLAQLVDLILEGRTACALLRPLAVDLDEAPLQLGVF